MGRIPIMLSAGDGARTAPPDTACSRLLVGGRSPSTLLPLAATWTAALILLSLTFPAAASAQADTLRLGALYGATVEADPRHRSLSLQERATALSLQNLRAARYPAVALTGTATYQSETASLPEGMLAGLPMNARAPEVPRDHYEVALEAEQLVYDGGRIAQSRRLEEARLAERRAEVRAGLYPLRQQVDRAFFGVLVAQERRAQLQTVIGDLEARRGMVRTRVQQGAAVGADAAALEAELIRLRQELDRAEGERLAALALLADLADVDVQPGDVLSAPDVEVLADSVIAAVLASPPSTTARRPELERLESMTERLRVEAERAARERRPRLAAFTRAAYGRPGFDFFDETFRPYAIVGLRVSWPAVDWGTTRRRAEVLELQAQAVETEADALYRGFRREVLRVLHNVQRLEAALQADERAVALREEIERTARRQLDEGVLLAYEYVDRRSDVFEARLRQRLHRVELAEARVRLLTTMGVDLPRRRGGRDLELQVDPVVEPFASARE